MATILRQQTVAHPHGLGVKPEPSVDPAPCPTCGARMHWRQNRTSREWFAGCTKWPKCSGTRDSDGVPSTVSPQRQNRMWAILKAAILHAEDECLTFSQAELEQTEQYELHLDEITEEKSYVLTVRKK